MTDAPRPLLRPAPPPPAHTQVNIAWFVGCVLVATAAISLVGTYAVALAMLVPLPAWEAAAYTLSLWVLRRATAGAGGIAAGTADGTATGAAVARQYVALTGLLLFTATVGGSVALHGVARRFEHCKERAASALLALFALLYGAAAVRLQVCGAGGRAG